MKIRILMQALKFVCLPTLAMMVLLFFGFFSISETIKFISSTNTLAVIIRIVLVIGEFALVYHMYEHYLKIAQREELLKNSDINGKNGYNIPYHTDIYQLERPWNSDDTFFKFHTENPDIIIIERKPKTR